MICTIGPSCRSPTKLERLIHAGMDVARLHFSYAAQSEHADTIRQIREVSKKLGRHVAILEDLSGSKARMVGFMKEPVRLEAGSRFALTITKVEGNNSAVSISVPELISVVTAGDSVLLADGALELRVLDTTDTEIRCEVIRGGTIKSQQDVHVLGKSPPGRVPTGKDCEDVLFGIQHRVDWIALSYVTTGQEVHELRQFIQKQGADTPIVAKIERAHALKDLGNILRAADAVMVARGDLGLEVSLEEIAWLQKDIIHRANAAGKPAITATEMLTSMMDQPRPTRAEVTDIANAVLDGSDALMLSGETAVGQHPIKAAETMVEVISATDEKHISTRTEHYFGADRDEEMGMAIARGACETALAFRAVLILCCTRRGCMARLVSQERPQIPIIGVSDSEEIARRMALFRGVHPLLVASSSRSCDSTINLAKEAVVKAGLGHRRDRVVIVAQDARQESEAAGALIRAEVL